MTNRLRPGGGWISGASVTALPPAAPDQHTTSPMVAEAIEALNAFGGDLTRAEARRILPMWRHYPDLAPRDVVAVLTTFPGKGDTR